MSVNVGDRTLSKIEVIYQATKVREALFSLSLRSFGVRSRNSILRRKYEQAIHLEGRQETIDELIKMGSRTLLNLASDIEMELNAANAIWPRSQRDYELRRSYQNKALSSCKRAKSELNQIAAMFDVDICTFKESVKSLDKEIELIKAWRRSDARRFRGTF